MSRAKNNGVKLTADPDELKDEKTEKLIVQTPGPAVEYEGEDDALERLMQEEFVKEGKTTLYRLPADGKKRVYVTTVLNSSFSTQWLAENYGGGNYEVCIRDSSGAVRFREKVDIDASVRPIATPSVPATNGNGNGQTMDLQKLLMATTGNKQDGLELIKGMSMIIAAAAPIVQAFANRPTAAPTSVSDAILLKLLDDKTSKQQSTLEILEIAERLADLKTGKRASLSDEEEGGGSMLEKVISAAAGGFASKMMGGGAPALPEAHSGALPANVVALNPAGAEHGKAAAPGSSPGKEPAPAGQSSMTFILEMILRGAERKGDPVSYVNVLEDLFEPADLDMLKAALRSPEWFNQIFPATDKRWIEARPWLSELRDELLTPAEDKNE